MPAPRMITYNGLTLSMSGWARRIGMNRGTLESRINRECLPFQEAINRPLNITKQGTIIGSGHMRVDGYRLMWINNKPILEHIFIAEQAVGRKLRGTEEVHHVNCIRSDNRPGNLVVCPDREYHKLLHIRSDALDKSGNANFRACLICKKYDDPKNMYSYKGRAGQYHRECRNSYQHKWRNKCQ